MLKNIIYQIFAFFHFLPGSGPEMHLERIKELEPVLAECSGVALLPSGNLAMINDSRNPAEVIITGQSGNILKKVSLDFADNRDWEEITYANGFLYVGDFGNNSNKRRDLKIYRLGVTDEDSLYDAGILTFSYARQKEFPPEERLQNYDMEAMVHAGDSLYLFSKNRTSPFTGYTYLYGMPAMPGQYELTPLDSFKTGEGLAPAFWITGAALAPSGKTLILLGYDKMWVFTDYPKHSFFKGQNETWHFDELSQKEAVTFISHDSLAITDEREDFFGGGYLYRGHLATGSEVSIYPRREIDDSLRINLEHNPGKAVLWEIYNTRGERLLFGTIKADSDFPVTIDTTSLPAGGYVINVIVAGTPHAFKVKKLLKTQMPG